MCVLTYVFWSSLIGCSVPFFVRAFYVCVYVCQLDPPIFSETKEGDTMWIRLCIGLAVSRNS